MAMMNDKHEVGKCDICHKEMTHIGCHGYIHGINEITRYCDECWEKEQGKPVQLEGAAGLDPM